MLKRLKQHIAAESFNPRVLGIWVNPFYFARKELRREIASFAPAIKGRVLDVGCGSKPYRELFTAATQYEGMEIDSPENRKGKLADFFYNGRDFPFLNESYDAIVCNQVLEHVFNPDQFLSEIARVLVPDGSILLTVPFVWDEHEQPWDYARYSSFGLSSLLERNGFTIIEQRKTNADARVIFQLINVYLYKILMTSYPALNVLIGAVILAPFTLLGMLFGKVLPANPDFYLDQVVLARKCDKGPICT